jgi:Tfp pilus assembly protein FimT
MGWGWRKGVETLINRAGLTVVEMMTGLAIAGVLVAAAAPAVLESIQTYRFNAAVRQVVGDIQRARSLAISQGDFYAFHAGADPFVNLPNQYRLELSTSPNGTLWPVPGDTTANNPNVISNWQDIPTLYSGVAVSAPVDQNGQVVTGVIFNSRGMSTNPFANVVHPLQITITAPGWRTRAILISRAGGVTVQ